MIQTVVTKEVFVYVSVLREIFQVLHERCFNIAVGSCIHHQSKFREILYSRQKKEYLPMLYITMGILYSANRPQAILLQAKYKMPNSTLLDILQAS